MAFHSPYRGESGFELIINTPGVDGSKRLPRRANEEETVNPAFAVLKGSVTYGGLAVLNLSGRQFVIQGLEVESAVSEARGTLDLKVRVVQYIEHLDIETHCSMKELAENRGLLLLINPHNCTERMRTEVHQELSNWIHEMNLPCPAKRRTPLTIIELSEMIQTQV